MNKQMYNQHNKGKVIFAGAGPGDPELITMKAARYLQQADVVLTDRMTTKDLVIIHSENFPRQRIKAENQDLILE